MNSTVTTKAKSPKRKSQPRKRKAASHRRVVKKTSPAFGIADWIAEGAGIEMDNLPEWKDLSSGKKARNTRKKAKNTRNQVASRLSQVPTSQFALVLLISALGLGLYVSHVFGTQETLSRVEQLRRDNLRLELQYNQLKGQLDKKLSPSIIYHRAQEFGLKEGLAFEAPIAWELKENKN